MLAMERVVWCKGMWICRRVGTGAHSARHGLNASAMDWYLECTGKGLFFQVGIDTQHAFGCVLWRTRPSASGLLDDSDDTCVRLAAPTYSRFYLSSTETLITITCTFTS